MFLQDRGPAATHFRGCISLDENKSISEQLTVLLEEYKFNRETLSRFLSLNEQQLRLLAAGELDFLPEDAGYRFGLFNKVMFLYLSAVEDKDLKLEAFLHVLISQHHLSKETISKMAGVEPKEVEAVLCYPPKRCSESAKYRIAVTAMCLRYFLKECEQGFNGKENACPFDASVPDSSASNCHDKK